MMHTRPCTFCGHDYVEPCDGKNPACGNRPLAEVQRAAKEKLTTTPDPAK